MCYKSKEEVRKSLTIAREPNNTFQDSLALDQDMGEKFL